MTIYIQFTKKSRKPSKRIHNVHRVVNAGIHAVMISMTFCDGTQRIDQRIEDVARIVIEPATVD